MHFVLISSKGGLTCVHLPVPSLQASQQSSRRLSSWLMPSALGISLVLRDHPVAESLSHHMLREPLVHLAPVVHLVLLVRLAHLVVSLAALLVLLVLLVSKEVGGLQAHQVAMESLALLASLVLKESLALLDLLVLPATTALGLVT